MARRAVIDIGTNSVLLLVADVGEQDGSLNIVEDISEITRLGKGIAGGKGLQPEAIRRTVGVIETLTTRCRALRADSITAVGTAILREAANREIFLSEARQRCGLEVEVISGEEEARLSYRAVRGDSDLGLPDKAAIAVLDVGGGSTEVVFGKESVEFRKSIPIGAVRLSEAFLPTDPPPAEEQKKGLDFVLERLSELPPLPTDSVFVGVGGTIVNLGAVHLGLAEYGPSRLHGMRLTRADAEDALRLLASKPLEERRQISGLEPKRADVIVGGAIIIAAVMKRYDLEAITMSCRGLRYGVLFDRYLR
ncbi:MAG: Ppx/GppA family phosphatase [Armatimonadetes bacterium]|nr:Ppx/GppA family phosphatase [Armatimonadota bacterium]